MTSEVISALIGALGVMTGTILGYWLQREAKKIAALERRVERYRKEIRARQAEEIVAANWLHELGVGTTQNSAKIALRDRAEKESGLRPSVGPSGVRDRGGG